MVQVKTPPSPRHNKLVDSFPSLPAATQKSPSCIRAKWVAVPPTVSAVPRSLLVQMRKGDSGPQVYTLLSSFEKLRPGGGRPELDSMRQIVTENER